MNLVADSMLEPLFFWAGKLFKTWKARLTGQELQEEVEISANPLSQNAYAFISGEKICILRLKMIY